MARSRFRAEFRRLLEGIQEPVEPMCQLRLNSADLSPDGTQVDYVPLFYKCWHGEIPMTMSDVKNEVQLGPQGRLVIPAHLRRALDLKPGDRLIARQEGDSIVLERREHMVKRLRARFAHVPADASLVDELIAERQAEAAQERNK